MADEKLHTAIDAHQEAVQAVEKVQTNEEMRQATRAVIEAEADVVVRILELLPELEGSELVDEIKLTHRAPSAGPDLQERFEAGLLGSKSAGPSG